MATGWHTTAGNPDRNSASQHPDPFHAGAASHFGDPTQDQTPSQVAEVERLKAQIEAMVAGMVTVADQLLTGALPVLRSTTAPVSPDPQSLSTRVVAVMVADAFWQ